MMYNYNITTLFGGASGILDAEDEAALKKILTKVYVKDFLDEDGKLVKNKITNFDFKEAIG